MRVNFGCGKNPVEGWINVDQQPGDGVDESMNLDYPWLEMPWADSSVDESMGLHVIEHLHQPLKFMQEVWRITKPGGTCALACPYGSSDDAWENPDHKRPYFLKSWGFFGQPNYWREGSYGYTADWEVVEVELRFSQEQWNKWGDDDLDEVMLYVNLYRNIITEQVVTLRAVKPAREQLKELQQPTPVRFSVLVPMDETTNRVVSVQDYEREME